MRVVCKKNSAIVVENLVFKSTSRFFLQTTKTVIVMKISKALNVKARVNQSIKLLWGSVLYATKILREDSKNEPNMIYVGDVTKVKIIQVRS